MVTIAKEQMAETVMLVSKNKNRRVRLNLPIEDEKGDTKLLSKTIYFHDGKTLEDNPVIIKLLRDKRNSKLGIKVVNIEAVKKSISEG